MKGDFEVDKEFHKDPSMRIVPLSLKQYFVYGIPVEQTILNDRDIFNFCMRLKTNSKSTPYLYYWNNKILKKKLNRTTRYYIGNGKLFGNLYKEFSDGRKTGVNVGYSATLFNEFEYMNWEDYKIDYRFYINEANKIKNPLIKKELSLF